jgi:Arc/MetJ-type ribon-helix-helix transcriptional regulator
MTRKSKTKISVTIDTGLLAWLDTEIAKFTFQSRSHAIEQEVYKLKKEMEQDGFNLFKPVKIIDKDGKEKTVGTETLEKLKRTMIKEGDTKE